MGETEIAKLTDYVMQMAVEKGPNLILAIITLALGWWGINVLTRVFRRAMNRSKNEISELSSFLSRFASIALKVMLLVSVAAMIGIETTSFIAVLGAAGLAVGLALQGSLANFAGGILIILFKPYKIGDYIDGTGGSGTVKRIDILHTVLVTFDNKVITIPNALLSNNAVVNYSMEENRRLDVNIGISIDSDMQKVRNVVTETISGDLRILNEPAPESLIMAINDFSMTLSIRLWVKSEDYWPMYFYYLETFRQRFEQNDIHIPFPRRDIQIIQK